ncbi:MAG: helix-turn-helix domain-containing protein [Deltaproteobacteria bacterium]|nr:helix-turn-helix domain-containing protein [Deltaproteobacteria bacterium]
MPRFEELNYYEIFEIPINASNFEIRQAYRNALSMYGEDSPISYAFFTEAEREEILERVEEAFSTLINDQKRKQYDKTLVDKKIIDSAILKRKRQKTPTPLFSSRSPGGDTVSKKIKRGIKEKDLKKIVDEILSVDIISGNDLKGLRMAVGITIEDLFEVTRISVATLKAMEEDDIEALPSPVYLKNFLKAYAEIFEANPQRIIDGYLRNLNHIRNTS